MVRVSLILVLFLSACAPQSGALVSPDTGLSGFFTRQIPISDDPNLVLMGHLIDVSRDGTRVRALVIGARRDGVNRFTARDAWVDGTRLPYRATTRLSDGCTHGQCRDQAVGNIYLSDALFAQAMANGLRARLVGYGGPVEISVPASLFQDLQSLAAAS